MCELFAMSSGRATNVNFSFSEFSRRGASTARNPDGWGVAYFDGRDVRLVREPEPTDDSACVRFLMDNAIDSSLVVSHVRRATQGHRSLPNTQPFARELGGRMHVFSHNGDLDGVGDAPLHGCHRPVGDTDSEYAFCLLLGQLAEAWRKGGGTPPFDERFDIVCAFAERLRPLGPANFIYSDGDALFVHAHRRTQPGEKSPRPPGVHVLERACQEATCPDLGPGLGIDHPLQRVVLFASIPLTDEGWAPLEEGEVVAARAGRLIRSSTGRRTTGPE